MHRPACGARRPLPGRWARTCRRPRGGLLTATTAAERLESTLARCRIKRMVDTEKFAAATICRGATSPPTCGWCGSDSTASSCSALVSTSSSASNSTGGSWSGRTRSPRIPRSRRSSSSSSDRPTESCRHPCTTCPSGEHPGQKAHQGSLPPGRAGARPGALCSWPRSRGSLRSSASCAAWCGGCRPENGRRASS